MTLKTLFIQGEMTIYQAQIQMESLLLHLVPPDAEYVIDLSQVSVLDTAGLQLLILAKKKAESMHKLFQIAALSEAVRSVFNAYGLAAFFNLHTCHPEVVSGAAENSV